MLFDRQNLYGWTENMPLKLIEGEELHGKLCSWSNQFAFEQNMFGKENAAWLPVPNLFVQVNFNENFLVRVNTQHYFIAKVCLTKIHCYIFLWQIVRVNANLLTKFLVKGYVRKELCSSEWVLGERERRQKLTSVLVED